MIQTFKTRNGKELVSTDDGRSFTIGEMAEIARVDNNNSAYTVFYHLMMSIEWKERHLSHSEWQKYCNTHEELMWAYEYYKNKDEFMMREIASWFIDTVMEMAEGIMSETIVRLFHDDTFGG